MQTQFSFLGCSALLAHQDARHADTGEREAALVVGSACLNGSAAVSAAMKNDTHLKNSWLISTGPREYALMWHFYASNSRKLDGVRAMSASNNDDAHL